MLLLAIVVHELCHVRLLGEERITSQRKDHERLTDLLTVFFGFGIFTTNAAMRFARRSDIWIVPQGDLDDRTLNASRNEGYNRLGYLSTAEFGHALSSYAWLRRELEPGWARFVTPGPVAIMRQGLSYLKAVSAPGDLPTRRLADSPIKVGGATLKIVPGQQHGSSLFGLGLPASRAGRPADPADGQRRQ